MPELPEVETIRRSLAPKVVDQRILQTELLLERLVKWPEPADFQGRLADRTIARIERTGVLVSIMGRSSLCICG